MKNLAFYLAFVACLVCAFIIGINVPERDKNNQIYNTEIETEIFPSTTETTYIEVTTTIDTEEKIETSQEIENPKTPMQSLCVNGDKLVVDGKEKVSVFWLWNSLRGCKCPYFNSEVETFCENIEDCPTLWDEATCAAILGNMQQECGLYYNSDYWFNAEIYGGGGGVYYGLCQWSPTRLKTAKATLNITNENPTAEEQIKILCWELTTPYFAYMNKILFEGCNCQTKTTCQCSKRIAQKFCEIFEAPDDKIGLARQEKAQNWFKFFSANISD